MSEKWLYNLFFHRYSLYLQQFSAIHNKDYSVVKTFRLPSSFNGGFLCFDSRAEFLIFQIENKEQGIEMMYTEEFVWCTQKAMSALFDVEGAAISKHLANVFEICQSSLSGSM